MRKNYDTPSLPEHCYAVLPNSGQLIEVRRGEMGYYPCAYSTGGRAYNQVLENYFNAHEGISKAQAAAMLAGSMFGWSVPAADPSRYDLDGEPVRPGVRKALPRSPQYLYEQAKLLREEYAPGTKVILDEAVKTDCKYIGDLVNEYADAKCQLSMLYDADPAHVEEQRQKGIAEADKLIANKVLEAIRTMLRKDRETGAFEYAEARKAYYTERLICEILMALEQNAVNMGMEYDDCQKAMGGDLSKAAKKDWYLRHKDRGMEP